MRGDRILNEKAPSGASYGRIAEFLFDEPGAGGQEGTNEQFAASFAVLARAVGIPARLVVGFELDGPTIHGTTPVTGSDARVWAQVYLSRAGWVDVDPSPDSSIDVPRTPPDARPEPTPATPKPATPSPAPSATDPIGAQPQTSAPADFWGSAAGPLGVGGVMVLVGLVALAVLVTLRARRRARWRAAGAAGAWAQVMDAAALAGRRPVAGATADATAATLAAGMDGETALTDLAARAQREAFAPDVPPPDDADWPVARLTERALRAGSTWWRRVVWPFSTAVFRRR